MDKTERHALAQAGKIILRAQLQKKGHYAIVFYTLNGGWCLFQGGPLYRFGSLEAAQDRIDDLITEKPDKYVNDNQ